MSTASGREGPVLIAVDFSEDSRVALLWGCAEAARWKLPVTILHVVHVPAENPDYYHQETEKIVRPLGDIAEDRMKEFLEQVLGENPHRAANEKAGLESRLVKGIPATRIIEVAKNIGAGQIVMGSRGQTGLKHLLLGSKAERVVQMARIPVTIIKAEKSRGKKDKKKKS